MLRASIYARYSSDNQREESIEAQTRAISEYANNNNYRIVKTYVDEAFSAKTDNRPQFLQMISDAKNRLFDVVICHKLDRFARNRYDSAFYKRILKENGIRLISVLENFDDSPESIILESVLEGMAEYYSANLAREVMKGLKENALQCKHTGGKPAFGYDVDKDKNYIINKHEAKAVLEIFEMVNSFHSVGEIISWLDSNGYRTKYGTQFTAGSINAIVRNEKYKGVYVYGKNKRIQQNGILKNVTGDDIVRIEDGIPRIISDSEWDNANKIYNERQHKAGGQAKAKEVYLLSGVIQCGLCGGSMCGNKIKSGRNKSLRITYKCNTRKAKKTCDAKDIRKDLIESIIIDELETTISEDGINKLVDFIMEQMNEMSKEIPGEINDLEKRLAISNKQIDSMVNAIMNGLFSDAVKEKLEYLELEKRDLLDRLKYLKINNDLANAPSKEKVKEILRMDMNIKNKSLNDQQRIIKTYIKKVVVYPTYVEIYSEVDTKSGAEGNRTPVRKPIHCSISHHSQSFNIPSV
jgi:site-specific DNA recombinase